MENLELSENEINEAVSNVRSLFTGDDKRLLNCAINELSSLSYVCDEWERNGSVLAFYLMMSKNVSCDTSILFDVKSRKVSVVNESEIKSSYDCKMDRYYDFIYADKV